MTTTRFTSNDNVRNGKVSVSARREYQVSAKSNSVWQGYVLVGILAAIAYTLVVYVLPYLH